jgi:hypothetical protein
MRTIKKTLEKTVYWVGILTLGIVLGVTIKIVGAWVEPSQAPPGGNIAAPFNTGNVGQAKIGGLTLNIGGATYGLIVQQGLVGIGTTAPSEKLEVNGNIKLTGATPTFKLINVASPTDASDVATKGYVDSVCGHWPHPPYPTSCGDSGGTMKYTCRVNYNNLSDANKIKVGQNQGYGTYFDCTVLGDSTCIVYGDNPKYDECVSMGGSVTDQCTCPAGTYSNPVVIDNDSNKKCFPASIKDNCTASGGQWLTTMPGDTSNPPSGNLSCTDGTSVIYNPVRDTNNKGLEFNGACGFNGSGENGVGSLLLPTAEACISSNYYCKCPTDKCLNRDSGSCQNK